MMSKICFVVVLLLVTCTRCMAFENLIDRIEGDIEMVEKYIEKIENNPSNTPILHGQFVQDVVKKDEYIGDITNILAIEFLQKHILSEDPKIDQKLTIIHKMLEQIYEVKRSLNIDLLRDFSLELQKFKRKMKSSKSSSRFNCKKRVKFRNNDLQSRQGRER